MQERKNWGMRIRMCDELHDTSHVPLLGCHLKGIYPSKERFNALKQSSGMLDIKLIREHPDHVRTDLKKRREPEKLEILEKLIKDDTTYRKLLKDLERLRHERNLKTQELGKRKQEGENIEKYRKELRELGNKIKLTEERVAGKKDAITIALYKLPNLLHKSVPQGEDDQDNKQLRTWGKKPRLAVAKGHEELGLSLGILDIKRAAKISGARFYFLKNEGALLDLALQQFALDFLVKKGFVPTLPPFLMRREPFEGVIDMNDFEGVLYPTEDDLYLIPTSEHPLIAQYQGETLLQGDLPIKLAGVSPCFRKEAGSHGKDTKGIFRVHQFNKIEQIVLSTPDESWEWHDHLLANTEQLFKKLELPYRVVNVCTGDIGSIAAKKYDLEVWFPVQKQYREAASCSNATDYQARRLKIKYGLPDAPAAGLVHAINNTALATTRTIAAIVENYQQKNGSVLIPRVLRPYLGGQRKIER